MSWTTLDLIGSALCVICGTTYMSTGLLPVLAIGLIGLCLAVFVALN